MPKYNPAVKSKLNAHTKTGSETSFPDMTNPLNSANNIFVFKRDHRLKLVTTLFPIKLLKSAGPTIRNTVPNIDNCVLPLFNDIKEVTSTTNTKPIICIIILNKEY